MSRNRVSRSAIDQSPGLDRLRLGLIDAAWMRSSSNPNQICVTIDNRCDDVAFLDLPQVGVEYQSIVESFRILVLLSRLNVRGFPQTDNHFGQKRLLGRLEALLNWMVLKGITRLENITVADLDEFIGGFRYGVATLLNYRERYSKVINDLIAKGNVPIRKGSRGPMKILDVTAVCDIAGIDVFSFRTDPSCAFESQRIAMKHGYYIRNPITDFSLSPASPEPQLVTETSLRKMLIALEGLREIGRRYTGLDHLKINPCPGGSAIKLARRLARPSGKTKTIPPSLGFKLIDGAIRWVVHYGPELLALRDNAELDFKNLSDVYRDNYPAKLVAEKLRKFEPRATGPGHPWPISGFKRSQATHEDLVGHPSLHVAVNIYLPAACAIVLEVFTARREGEILGLKKGCIQRIGGNNQLRKLNSLTLETYIEKTVRSIDKVPVVEIVEVAIALLEKWSEKSRALSGSDLLFQCRDIASDHIYPWTTKDHLTAFAKFVEADVDALGQSWKYSDHQFRRLFAMLYFWRFEGSSLTALSEYLRHFNLEMTKQYIQEIVGGEIFHEIHQAKLSDILRKSFAGELNLAGLFGERLNRLQQMYSSQVRADTRVVSERRFQDVMREKADDLVESERLSMQITPWGVCFGSSPNRQRFSQCVPVEVRRSAPRPLPERSTPKVCAGCPNHMIWMEFQPSLEQARKNAASILQAGPNIPPIFKAAIEDQLDQINGQLADISGGSNAKS